VPLAISPCRALCAWSAAGPALLTCAGCGSQWAPSERWTPRQADGSVPGAVLAARGPQRWTAPVSGGTAGVAGSAGS